MIDYNSTFPALDRQTIKNTSIDLYTAEIVVDYHSAYVAVLPRRFAVTKMKSNLKN